MSILKDILGGKGVVEAGFDLIDSIHTSTEEEIAANSKAKTDLLTAYHPFKKAQRFLTMLFGFTYVFSFLLLLSIELINGANPENIKMLLSEFYIGEIVLTIVIFYFGGGVFEGAAEKVRKIKEARATK